MARLNVDLTIFGPTTDGMHRQGQYISNDNLLIHSLKCSCRIGLLHKHYYDIFHLDGVVISLTNPPCSLSLCYSIITILTRSPNFPSICPFRLLQISIQNKDNHQKQIECIFKRMCWKNAEQTNQQDFFSIKSAINLIKQTFQVLHSFQLNNIYNLRKA